ncbi:MAG: hypothetical protein R3F61_30240 [Myxococcota bacterium]
MSLSLASVLFALVGCGGPSLDAHVAGLNPVPTDKTTVSVAADGATLHFVQPVDLGFSGETLNEPEGTAELALSVHVTTVKLGDVVVPVGRTVDVKVPYHVKGGDLQGAETARVELDLELDDAATEALRAHCGKKLTLWYEATWKASADGQLPPDWTISGGEGELHNLLDPPSARIECVEMAAGEGEPAEGGAEAAE